MGVSCGLVSESDPHVVSHCRLIGSTLLPGLLLITIIITEELGEEGIIPSRPVSRPVDMVVAAVLHGDRGGSRGGIIMRWNSMVAGTPIETGRSDESRRWNKWCVVAKHEAGVDRSWCGGAFVWRNREVIAGVDLGFDGWDDKRIRCRWWWRSVMNEIGVGGGGGGRSGGGGGGDVVGEGCLSCHHLLL